MSFDEKITALIQRIPDLVDHLQTEEATKNALVMPFVAALGYDIFNPREVIPEFTADIGTKKREKVDYAIFYNDEIIFLIECKKVDVDLNYAEMSQLFRYFHVTNARIGILTNGIRYRFYSDLDKQNVMDERPFLDVDLTKITPQQQKEIKKLARNDFNISEILKSANELKYSSAIIGYLNEQYEAIQPDEEFVRFFFRSAKLGTNFTNASKERLTPLVKKAFEQFINEKVDQRLEWARNNRPQGAEKDNPPPPPDPEPVIDKPQIVTTEEEIEGYIIVKSICMKVVEPQRVVKRDTLSYLGILLDDNKLKPICRLYFNGKNKSIILFDQERKEVRQPIETLTDIYKFSEDIITTIETYEN